MQVANSKFLMSVVNIEDYPQYDNKEFILLGRSNVGKSTFINTICNNKSLAKISSKPGKTQTLNFYYINDLISFVDAPGYGYAKVSKKQREVFGEMIENYLFNRPNCIGAILLIDFKVGPTKDDLLMYEFLMHHDIKTIIICTKKDKIKKSAQDKQKKLIKEQLKRYEDICFYSANIKEDVLNIHQILDRGINN